MSKLDIILSPNDEYYGIYVDDKLEVKTKDVSYPGEWCEIIKKYKSFSIINEWQIKHEVYQKRLDQNKRFLLLENFNDYTVGELIKYNED